MRPLRTAMHTALCLLGLTASFLSAQETTEAVEAQRPAPVMIRASMEPETGVYVGQKVKLNVDVMTNTWFPKAPQFPELRIPEAICLELSQFGINFTERIEGETYAVQRKEYVIYPQRAEQYAVPSLTVVVVYARPGQPHGEVSLNSPTQTFRAQIPEQAKGLDYFVTTPRLQVNEVYDPPLDGLKVGNSVKRTVTMSADDSVGMLLPPLEFSAEEGLAVYPNPPRMEDEGNRGVYTGRRIESVTYLMEKKGEYTLPEISIHWFDLKTNQLKTEILPAVNFSVVANPDLEQEMLTFQDEEEAEPEKEGMASAKRKFDIKNIVYLFIAIGIVFMALWVFIIPFLKRFFAWRKKQIQLQAQSEKAYFKRFREAARSGNPSSIMNSLMAWLDRAYKKPGTITLTQFVDLADDAALEDQAKRLEFQLFGSAKDDLSEKEFQSKNFFNSVAKARKSLLRKKKISLKSSGLQPLNP